MATRSDVKTITLFCRAPRNSYMSSEERRDHPGHFSAAEISDDTCIKMGVLGKSPNDLPGDVVYLKSSTNKKCLRPTSNGYCYFNSNGPAPDALWICLTKKKSCGLLSFLHLESRLWLQWKDGRMSLRAIWPSETNGLYEIPMGRGQDEYFQIAAWPYSENPLFEIRSFFQKDHQEYMCAKKTGSFSVRDPRSPLTRILIERYCLAGKDTGGTIVTLRANSGRAAKYLEIQPDGYCSFRSPRLNSEHFWIMIDQNEYGEVAILHRDTRRWLQWAHGRIHIRPHDQDYEGIGLPQGIGSWEVFQTVAWPGE